MYFDNSNFISILISYNKNTFSLIDFLHNTGIIILLFLILKMELEKFNFSQKYKLDKVYFNKRIFISVQIPYSKNTINFHLKTVILKIYISEKKV